MPAAGGFSVALARRFDMFGQATPRLTRAWRGERRHPEVRRPPPLPLSPLIIQELLLLLWLKLPECSDAGRNGGFRLTTPE